MALCLLTDIPCVTLQDLLAIALLSVSTSFARPMNSTRQLLDQSGFVYASETLC